VEVQILLKLLYDLKDLEHKIYILMRRFKEVSHNIKNNQMLLDTLESLWAIQKVDNSKLATFEEIKKTIYSHSLEIYPEIQHKIKALEASVDT